MSTVLAVATVVLLVLCMVINGLVRRHALKPQRGAKRHALYSERLKNFFYTLAHWRTTGNPCAPGVCWPGRWTCMGNGAC